MKHVTRLLLTIALNLAVLATTSGWMMSEFGTVVAGADLGWRSSTLRIDQHGWMLEDGVFPFR